MPSTVQSAPISGKAIWAGRILSGFVILFLLFDSVIKLVPLDIVTQTMAQLGYPASVNFARGIGILTLVCIALYSIPRTAVLGAILLTGLLGGAIATHLRVDSPVFTHILFGFYLGVIIWGGAVPARCPAARPHSPATLTLNPGGANA